MATRYVGVRKNKLGTGWVYSVKKPGNQRPSYYRTVFTSAKSAAITRELEIINNKYDESIPANERNFTDSELKMVKPGSVPEIAVTLEQEKAEGKAEKKDKKAKKKKKKKKDNNSKKNKKDKGKKKKDKAAKKKGNKKDKKK